MRLEVVRSRQGSAARAVEVPWDLLTPGGPSDAGAGSHGLDAPPVPMPPSTPFRRVRACTLRDGLVGIHGQRPGRGPAAAAVRSISGSRVLSPRIVYVHLPRFPVQRRVLEEPGLAGLPLALVHEAKGAQRVAFASGTAQRDGVRAGMTLTAARALLPALRDAPFDVEAETRALSSVAEGFLRFTPAFMLSAPDGVWLDASATSLFGGEAGLVEKVEALARTGGYRARVVLASELFTARALARHGAPTRACVAPGGSARALGALPLQALEEAPEVVASLRALGLSTLGELAALQPTQVISRLGAEGLRAQRLVRGQDETRLLPAVLPEVVEEVRTLEAPAESLEPLLFALKAALDRLSARLRGRQRAAVRLTLTLILEPAGPHPVPLALARPTTDPKLLLDLVRHRLESVRLDAPVATLVLTVDESCEDHGQQGVLGRCAGGRRGAGDGAGAPGHRARTGGAGQPGPRRRSPPRGRPFAWPLPTAAPGAGDVRRGPALAPARSPCTRLAAGASGAPALRRGRADRGGARPARSALHGARPRQAAGGPGRRGAGAARRPVVDRVAIPARLLPGPPRGPRTGVGVSARG